MPYLRNSWYVAAWSDEVADGMFARTLLDTPVVFFREGDRVVALHDMCPHRFAPLSLGTLNEGKVRCGYHGLEFDSSGQCVGSCLNVAAPRAARVRSFPTVEQDKMIWIWLGDEEAKPVDTIPRFPHHTDEVLLCNFGLTLAKADYRLLSDNLMDLTHTALLHPGFGGLDYQAKVKCWEEGDEVVANFTIKDMPDFIDPESGGTVDHCDEIRWYPAGIHYLASTTIIPGAESGLFIPSAHILTPETEDSTHYFWSSAYDRTMPFSKEDMLAALVQAFDHEDKPMVEAVQRRMGGKDFWDMKPLLLATDAGGVRMRRKLNALIEAEEQARAARLAETQAAA